MSKLVSINGYDIKVSKKDIINKLQMIYTTCTTINMDNLDDKITLALISADTQISFFMDKKAFDIKYTLSDGEYLLNDITLKTSVNLTMCVNELMAICDFLLKYGKIEYVDKLLPGYRPNGQEVEETQEYTVNAEPVEPTEKAEPVQEVEPVEEVHITIDNTPDLIKSVIELEKVKKSDNVISENTVNNVMKRFSIKDLPNKYSNAEYNLKQMTTNDLKHWKVQGCLDDEETGILYIAKNNEIDYLYIGNKCPDCADDIIVNDVKLAIYFDGDDLMVKAKNDVDIDYITNAIDEILSIYDEANNTMFCRGFVKVEPIENAELVQVEEIPKSNLLDYVMKNFDLTERQISDINRFYPDFIDKKEFGYIIDFLNDIYGFVSYAIKLINKYGSYDTLDMYNRSDIVERIFSYSVSSKELFENGDNLIFILMHDCLSSNNSRYISKCNNRLYIENDVLIEKEFLNISYDKRNDILDLIEHCEHFTTKRELLSIVSKKFNISKDIVIELYNKYMDNLYLDENIEPVEETPTVEPVEETPTVEPVEEVEKTELTCNYSKCPVTLYDCFKCQLGKKCESYEFRVGSLVCMLHDCDSPMSSSYVIERFEEMGVTTKDIIQLYDMYSSGVYIKPDENVIQYLNKDIERLKSLELDINTSYPELQCFEDIEKVEENTVFKVGCFYTGSDKSLYLVTKRGLNTIDLMSISKGFQLYDEPIITDIYDNESVTISYSNRISNISSINLTYTEKSEISKEVLATYYKI